MKKLLLILFVISFVITFGQKTDAIEKFFGLQVRAFELQKEKEAIEYALELQKQFEKVNILKIDSWYKVIIGQYSYRNNAEQNLDLVKSNYKGSWIVNYSGKDISWTNKVEDSHIFKEENPQIYSPEQTNFSDDFIVPIIIVSLLLFFFITSKALYNIDSNKTPTQKINNPVNKNHLVTNTTPTQPISNKEKPEIPLSKPSPTKIYDEGWLVKDPANKIILNHEAKEVLHLMQKTSKCIFLTGKAGTGKSTLLNYFLKHTNKKIQVLAPTGVAALNVNGSTIHSFFKLSWDVFDLKNITIKEPERYQLLDAIIIDEISMVRVDLLNAIESILRRARNNFLPFGGIQMIFIGDPYQLPPVVKNDVKQYFADNFEGVYFFHADSFKAANFMKIELQKVHRQTDVSFINALNGIRNGSYNKEQINTINSIGLLNNISTESIILTTKREIAENENLKRMQQLPLPEYIYHGIKIGNVENDLPTPVILKLRIGAKVMFVVNDPDRRWVNGSIGEVVGCTENMVSVNLKGRTHTVGMNTWEKEEYVYDKEKKKLNKEVVGSYMQIPLLPAWAITIHKSQGKTFDKVHLNLGTGAFACGQTYVALSRCTSLSGLSLQCQIKPSDIKVDQTIVNFMKN